MHELHSIRSRGGKRPATAEQTAGDRGPRPHDGQPTLENQPATTLKIASSSATKRTVSGPPPPGGPIALLDAYHDQLRDAVKHVTERGFARSWAEDGLPQVNVFVGPRDERGRPECLLVLRAQAAFDFAWRMYDWAMGQKRDAEHARDGSALVLWRANAARGASRARPRPAAATECP